MGILAVYDVTGIQDYVFASNKLKENIGASSLVAQVLNEYICTAINEVCKKKAKTDWKALDAFFLPDDPNLLAEIIYIGGGNAMVAYSNSSVFNSVNRLLAKKTLENTRSLGVSVAAIQTEFTDTYSTDRKILFEKRLRVAKQQQISPHPVSSLSITRRQAASGYPIVSIEKDSFDELSAEQECKRKEYNCLRERQASNDGTIEAIEFDRIYTKKGEDSYIGIIHIDGNNMGNRISSSLQNFVTYKEAVPKMRCISKEISSTFTDALSISLSKLKDSYMKNAVLKNKIRQFDKSTQNKIILPWRQLIGEGDDITFVMNGRIAVPFAAQVLKEIESIEMKTIGKASACAGIALVRHSFPFSAAYELAEECCKNAKKRAREGLIEGSEMQSWLDFHIHKSHSMESLKSLRSQYTKREYGEKEELLWRPYCVSDPDSVYSFTWLANAIDQIQSNSGIRSHAKKLRSALIEGKIAANEKYDHMKWRGYKLPVLPNNLSDELFVQLPQDNGEWKTPYFDVLDLADIYEKIL